MRRTGALAIAGSLLVTIGSVVSSPAATAAGAPGWIRQAGDATAASRPLIPGFQIADLLFSQSRFTVGDAPPINDDRFIGYGTLRSGTPAVPSYQLASVRGGYDGLRWEAPRPSTLRDQQGQDVPFLIGDPLHLAVAFQDARDARPAYTIVYVRNGTGSVMSRMRMAFSYDGGAWFDDAPVLNDTEGITGAGFKADLLGPTDLFVNFNASNLACRNGATFDPWSCRYTLVYTADSNALPGAIGTTSIALAGANVEAPLGTTFQGMTAPIFSGAGAPASWDDARIDLAKLRQATEQPSASRWELAYVGASSTSLSCENASSLCTSVGIATSATNVGSFAGPTTTSRAAVEPGLLQGFFGAENLTLGPLMMVNDGGPRVRALFGSRDGTGANNLTSVGSTWLGFGSAVPCADPQRPPPAPADPQSCTGPFAEVSSPDNGTTNASDTDVDLFFNDEFGSTSSKIGLNAGSLDVRIDGRPITDLGGGSLEPTLVGAWHSPGLRLRFDGSQLRLPDGTHTMIASIKDLDGRAASISTIFVIDTAPPTTNIATAPPSDPAFGPPLAAPMVRITGATEDLGTGISSIQAEVTNLTSLVGYKHVYDNRNPGSGFFAIVKDATNSRWTWEWAMPIDDPIMWLPGPYQVTIRGIDGTGNVEIASATNTTNFIILV